MDYDLERFLKAQERDYPQALAEIRAGRKRSHWIWYIFPQLRGLGYSRNAAYYGIENMEEARAYLSHPLLGTRLVEISRSLLAQPERDPLRVMGSPDDKKLRSSMTLFDAVQPGGVFGEVLEAFYGGVRDKATLDMI